MHTTSNKQILTAILNELSRGNAAPFVEAMTEDFTWRVMGASRLEKWQPTYAGKASVRFELFAPLLKQFAGRFITTPIHIFADGDYVIAETEGTATTKAGNPYCNKYCMVIRMEGGKMREVREYFDSALADATLSPLAS